VRLLLDTHALIWWMVEAPALSALADAAIADPENEVFVSAASAWEVATKYRIGKLPEAGLLANDFAAAVAGEGFVELSIGIRDGDGAGRLPGLHRDPFDRMLIAQALAHSLTLISNERLFDRYGVARLW
jgi:PIN domain nuclease of toxin-antitoxin system